jgi:hypothetical protein
VGHTAGATQTDRGSGANFLCLTEVATADGTNAADNGGGQIWSTEYNMRSYPTSTANLAGFSSSYDLDNFEVPCTVCMRTAVNGFTIWGTDTCPANSDSSYGGYAAHGCTSGQCVGRTTFECLDNNMVTGDLHSTRNDKSSLSLVEGTNVGVGYPNDIEISCARCSFDHSVGGVFTLWGKLKCPPAARAVYAGYMVASVSSSAYGDTPLPPPPLTRALRFNV